LERQPSNLGQEAGDRLLRKEPNRIGGDQVISRCEKRGVVEIMRKRARIRTK